MPCPHRVLPGQPGSLTIRVQRRSNVNKVVMVIESVDRTTGAASTRTLRTAQLEQGEPHSTAAGFSYNLELGAVRSSADQNGSVKVTIDNNATRIVDSTCSVNGTNPTGSWTIIVP